MLKVTNPFGFSQNNKLEKLNKCYTNIKKTYNCYSCDLNKYNMII